VSQTYCCHRRSHHHRRSHNLSSSFDVFKTAKCPISTQQRPIKLQQTITQTSSSYKLKNNPQAYIGNTNTVITASTLILKGKYDVETQLEVRDLPVFTALPAAE
jgi:hypothetical protein